MKKNNSLHRLDVREFVKILGCLFATTLVFLSVAEASWVSPMSADEYDSSFQRSNFLILDPRYEDELKDSLSDRRTQLIWKLRFDGQSLETESNNQSQIAGATFRGKFKYRILDNVRFKAKADLSLESGRSQDIFGDQEPGSGIYAREFIVQWDIYKKNLGLDVGLLQQKLFYTEPLFIGNLAFVGAVEKIRFQGKRYDVALYAQQSIPSSYTRSTRVSEREEIPYFYTESLVGRLGLSSTNFVFGSLTHYRYENLPAIVAFDSAIFGNSVLGGNPNNSRFEYEFEGFMSHLGFEQRFTNSLSTQFWWNTITNNEAPSDAGEAQSFNVKAANDFGRWIVGLNWKNFFIESDAVPGAYNSHVYGHNNRIGNSFGFSVESKDWGVNFNGSYTNADLLNDSTQRTFDNLQQDNQQTIYFSVETMYDSI